MGLNESTTGAPADVVGAFRIYGTYLKGNPYGGGHINQTYLLEFDQAGLPVRYILQRINEKVFPNPELVMQNIRRVTDWSRTRLQEAGVPDATRRALSLVPTHSGEHWHHDGNGGIWRCYFFIAGAKTYDRIENETQAYQASRAFGEFQRLVSDMPGERLQETIANFHHTRSRYDTLIRAIEADTQGRARSVQAEIDFVRSRENLVDRVVDGIAAGEIPERVTHNDTKLNNVMIDEVTHEAVCVIDLDTVMPGSALYDFGDMVRTATSPALEDEQDLSKVRMQMPMFQALVRGYLEGAGGFLNGAEISLLPFSGKLITLEIGIRFLTDYLQGDQYFRIHREGHNLDRCRTQFRLVESIEAQEKEMEKAVEAARCAS